MEASREVTEKYEIGEEMGATEVIARLVIASVHWFMISNLRPDELPPAAIVQSPVNQPAAKIVIV